MSRALLRSFTWLPSRALGAACAALLIGGAATAVGATPEEAWRTLTRLDADTAERQFAPHAASGSPSARLGEALALLQRQPRTEARYREVQGRLRALEHEAAGTPWARWARYYRARAAMLYPREPDFTDALGSLHSLFSNGEEDEVADQARVKFAICRLASLRAATELNDALTSLASTEKSLVRPTARRDYHLAVLEFLLSFEAPPAVALRHALAADAVGVQQTITRNELWIIIGNLALAAGESATARQYFERFLAEVPRDKARGLVKLRLQQLQQPETVP